MIFFCSKDLETKSLNYRRSENEEIYAIYDRYANIAARGHCKEMKRIFVVVAEQTYLFPVRGSNGCSFSW